MEIENSLWSIAPKDNYEIFWLHTNDVNQYGQYNKILISMLNESDLKKTWVFFFKSYVEDVLQCSIENETRWGGATYIEFRTPFSLDVARAVEITIAVWETFLESKECLEYIQVPRGTDDYRMISKIKTRILQKKAGVEAPPLKSPILFEQTSLINRMSNFFFGVWQSITGTAIWEICGKLWTISVTTLRFYTGSL